MRTSPPPCPRNGCRSSVLSRNLRDSKMASLRRLGLFSGQAPRLVCDATRKVYPLRHGYHVCRIAMERTEYLLKLAPPHKAGVRKNVILSHWTLILSFWLSSLDQSSLAVPNRIV